VTPVKLEVTSAGDLEALAKALAGRPIDVLINNAGVNAKSKSVEQLSAEELEQTYRVNVVAPMMVTRAVLGNLRAGAQKKIVNISSMMGSLSNAAATPDAKSYAYRSSKSALNMLTVCLANELRSERFTCVAVHPGWVQTDMGGEEAPLSVEESVRAMVAMIDELTVARTGRFVERNGDPIAW
jgi:NAD(P)-dependent dehydrogenase (short-subunit alcohol dehydrogenase family)